jgi:hypothetical protein
MEMSDARHAGERRGRDLLRDSGGVVGGALPGGPGISSQFGRLAAELLFARLTDDQRAPQRVVLLAELVVRGSGQIAP